jgi:hypothetical protein
MKIVISLITVLSLLTACGPTKNNPLENYKNLNLSAEAQSAPQKVDYKLVTETKEIPVIQEKIVEVTVERPVIQQQAVYIMNCPASLLQENEGNYRQCLENLVKTSQQISVDGIPYEVKTYSDAGLLKEEAMIFTEGVESSYYINAKVLYRSKVRFDLLVEDQPTTATITEIANIDNSVTYKITWKPQGVIEEGTTEDRGTIKVSLTELEYIDASAYNNNIMQITFDAISKTMTKEILVKKAGATTSTTGTSTPTTGATAPTNEITTPKWGPQ